MSRNIVVRFSNGTSYTYENVPNNVRSAQIVERARQEHPDRGTPSVQGTERVQVAAEQSGSQDQRYASWSPDQARNAYRQGRQALQAQFRERPQVLRQALEAFDNSADAEAWRWIAAGRPSVRNTSGTTVQAITAPRNRRERDQALRQAGRDIQLERRQQGDDPAQGVRGFAAGLGQGLFGAGPYIEAGIDKLTGSTPLSFGDQVEVRRGMGEQASADAPISSTVGLVGGALSGGGAGATAVRGAGAAAKVVPGLRGTGNFLQGLTRLEQANRVNRASTAANAGRIARNTGRLAAGGAAQANVTAQMNEDENVGTQTAIGAAAGPVGATVVKGVGAAIRGTNRLLRPTSGNAMGRALAGVVEESPEELAARQAQMSQNTGSNAPLIAALKPADHGQVVEEVVNRSRHTREVARNLAGERVAAFPNRMGSHVDAAAQSISASPAGRATQAVAGRQGATQVTEEDLGNYLNTRMREAMAPIEDTPVPIDVSQLDNLTVEAIQEAARRTPALREPIREALGSPTRRGGQGGDELDRAAREIAARWGLGEPAGTIDLTVREADELRQILRDWQKGSVSNPPNAAMYGNAAESLTRIVNDAVPEYGRALDEYAGNMRMIEGFQAGAKRQRPEDIQKHQMRANLRTDEGAVGQTMGVVRNLMDSTTKSFGSALRTADELAERTDLTRPRPVGSTDNVGRTGIVTENLGPQAAERLASVAEDEAQIVRRMLDADRLRDAIARNEDIGVQDLIIAATLPSALPTTKARFIAQMFNKVQSRVHPRVAENLTDMLFSSDPAKTQQAMAALRAVGVDETGLKGMLRNALVPDGMQVAGASGSLSAQALTATPDDTVTPVGSSSALQDYLTEQPVEEELDLNVEMPEFVMNAADSPYYGKVESLYTNAPPEFVDLVNAMLIQESGGRQFDANGNPLESPAGAIGVAQVMPRTGPEAAADAGLPWDEEAYRTDTAYNLAIGAAYLAKLLDLFDHDVDKALAAYNGGLGNVQNNAAARGDNWIEGMPAETFDYVNNLR